jgi:hypothetical protein
MERKNLLFIKKNCGLSNKLSTLIDDTYKTYVITDIKLPAELTQYEVPFLIVKNITKPLECENAIAYLENLKYYNQQTNNITNKIVQMKPIVNELDQKGISSEFKKITDEYTFIEDGKNIETIHRLIENCDDSKKIDIMTDYNSDTKLKETETASELKDMVLNRNRQLNMFLRSRR